MRKKLTFKQMFSKKPIRMIVIVFLIFMFVLSLIWYFGMCHQYVILNYKMFRRHGTFQKDIPDEENYCRALHYPDYLSWHSGNLSIGSPLDKPVKDPETGKNMYVASDGSGLIIWLKPFCGGIKELGVELDGRQIYLEDNKTARYPEQQPYVDTYQDEINKLFRKAEEEWDLEMPWNES